MNPFISLKLIIFPPYAILQLARFPFRSAYFIQNSLRSVLQTAFAPRFARCSCVCAKKHKICFQAGLKQILSFFGLFYKSSSIAVLLAYAVERASKKSVFTILASAYWDTHFMDSGSFS